MGLIAQWLEKTWEVSPKKIMSMENLTTSYKLKADTKDDAEGKPSTNVRGLELQPLSLETLLSDSVGVNVWDEIETWGKLVGESSPLTLGGRRFGPEKLQLVEVKVLETIVDDKGRMRQARLSLNFREDSEEAAKGKPQNTGNTKSKLAPGIASASTYTELGLGGSASRIGASSKDKADMKPDNLQFALRED